MIKYKVLNKVDELLNELPAAERLAHAKRAQKSNAKSEIIMLSPSPAYWYISR